MIAQNLKQRSTQPELMDTERVGFDEFHSCLRDLEIINRFTLAYRPTLSWLKRQMADVRCTDIAIFDIGSGGGDMLRRIWKWARRRRIRTELTGIDINDWSKRSAELATPSDWPIRYETADIFTLDPDRRADFIISSLFTHHLSDKELVRFIGWMDRHARHGWFINDLHRHFLPRAIIHHAVRMLRFNRLIIHDAPLSVARAFTRADWKGLLREAGIPDDRVRIRWYMPFRYGVECRK
jgi:2-polyprenyl-3-methyl-5-hydroxy-6-metoxy-1,4-benzoquinol methylase